MSNDWQRLPIDKASSGYVAQVALSAPQAVQREPEIPLPLSVPRIAFHQAAHDLQRLVVAAAAAFKSPVCNLASPSLFNVTFISRSQRVLLASRSDKRRRCASACT